MLQILSFFILLATAPLCSTEQQSWITYTPEEMQTHKEACKNMMRNDTAKRRDGSYQMARALKTIDGDDCDAIPKVPGAGEIFYEEGKPPYQLMHNGVKIVADCYYDSQWLTDVMSGLKGHHEPQEEKCFYEVLKYIPKNATMIELGAYWGYYSLWFLTEIEGAKSYLIEPSPKNLEVGKRNFELNNKNGVFCRGYAGAMTEYFPDMAGAKRISIDQFIEEQNIDHVHILHADIQGAEYEMLQTTTEHLSKIDYFFISTHGNDQAIHFPCIHFLESHGFIILAEHTCAQSCSGDGLIVAKRKGVCGPEHIDIRKY